jgi:hypothetical protein
MTFSSLLHSGADKLQDFAHALTHANLADVGSALIQAPAALKDFAIENKMIAGVFAASLMAPVAKDFCSRMWNSKQRLADITPNKGSISNFFNFLTHDVIGGSIVPAALSVAAARQENNIAAYALVGAAALSRTAIQDLPLIGRYAQDMRFCQESLVKTVAKAISYGADKLDAAAHAVAGQFTAR